MTADLSEESLRAAVYCASAVIRSRQRSGQPIPDWLRRHHARLDAAIREMSRARHVDVEIAAPGQQLIGADEAAVILHSSTRQVQRTADSLGGQRVSGRLVFDRDVIVEHARKKGHRA